MTQSSDYSVADSASERALLDYLDDLLCDAPRETAAPEIPLRAAAANVTPLPAAAPRPARPTPLRTFAEPGRPLNLRMPLPPLAPPPVEAPVTEAPVVDIPVEAPAAPRSAPAAEVPVASPPAGPPPAPAAAPEVPAPVPEEEQAIPPAMAAPAPWPDNGRPQWAQTPFECLLFQVGGLTLAVPLVELGSIHLLEEGELTPIFGQIDWFMGLLKIKQQTVRAIDTAQVVMPERYREAMRDGYRYVITLNGSDWGLAVDRVANAVVLDPDAVRWRGQRSQRPWLAGTVVAHMCALLDVAQLAWMFHNRDRKRRPRR